MSELDALTAKNLELLDELKTIKAKNKELVQALEAEKGKAAALDAKLNDIHLNGPVDELLQQLFIIAPKYARQELQDFYQFSLGDDATVQFRDKNGEPVRIKDGNKMRDAGFNQEDIYAALSADGRFDSVIRGSGQSGSGAQSTNSGAVHAARQTAKPAVARVDLGLR
jgi:hypothetical protein